MNRRIVDNHTAAALCPHDTSRRARTEKCAAQVNVEHFVPFVHRHFYSRVGGLIAGIVHENINAAKHIDNLGKKSGNLFFVAHIGLKSNSHCFAGCSVQVANQLVRRCAVPDIVDCHPGACGNHLAANGSPDPTASTCHHDTLAV